MIALVPKLQGKLPKPGRWMDRLKLFLAIPMAATAVVASATTGGCTEARWRPASNWPTA